MPIAQTRLEELQIRKLLQCIREQDRDQIEKLVLNGVPYLINLTESANGSTALSTAAIVNDDETIKFLLDLGAHPDVTDLQGRTAAMRAAEYGHVQCLERLCKARADMKKRDFSGKSVLYYCNFPTDRHRKCLEIAATNGADPNSKSEDGTTAFLYACETASENENCCLLLLEKGADPNLKNEVTFRTPLMAAAGSGSAAVVQAILQRGADANQVMNKSKTHAAHDAAKGGHLGALQAMAAYGTNFDQLDSNGNTPIHLAAMGDHALCCRFLSQRGCNPRLKNRDGLTARLIAKEKHFKATVKECSKAEKSFGTEGNNNFRWAIQLYDFCYDRRAELEKAFKKLDGAVEAGGSGSATGKLPKEDFLDVLRDAGAPLPADEAVVRRLLLAHTGATLDSEGAVMGTSSTNLVNYQLFLSGKKYLNKHYLATSYEGKKKKKKGGGKKGKRGGGKIPMPICTQSEGPRTPSGAPNRLFVPLYQHHTDTGRFNRDKPPSHPMEDDSAWYLHRPQAAFINVNNATRHCDLDTLKNALGDPKLVNVRDRFFKTPLMVACMDGNLVALNYLLQNGAEVNATDNFKWTPLHFACHSGLKDMSQALLERGAKLEARTMCGATPLMRAIESSNPELVQFLIDRGAKVQIENLKGQNPVDFAATWADFRVYDIVKKKWDSLPPPSDKKKGVRKGGSANKPKPANATTTEPPVVPVITESASISLQRRKAGSVLRASSALAKGVGEESEDITYTPLNSWRAQPTTDDLLTERSVKRERFGWEVDFEDFQMPFSRNVTNKIAAGGNVK